MYRLCSNIAILSLMLFFPAPCFAWSLKTHVWIGQQVLNDVADDGSVTLAGRNYAVPPDVAAALNSYPAVYRMGNMGPDVFPDPVVGQTTTHPGVDDGWQTGDWLRHLLNSAQTPQDLAMAYGFAGHSAGDIFAHTYVNAYSGDIFSLTDGEVDVERRHFVLEKFIESQTPIPRLPDGSELAWGSGLDTNANGLRDALILNEAVARQNLDAGTGLHLAIMYEERVAVVAAKDATDAVIGEITDFAADYFKRHLDLTVDIATGATAIEAAKVGLAAEQALLDAQEEAHELALGALEEANSVIQKYPELFTFHTAAVEATGREATRLAADLANEVSNGAKAIADIDREISRLQNEIADFVCGILGGHLLDPKSPPRIRVASIDDVQVAGLWEDFVDFVDPRDEICDGLKELQAAVDTLSGRKVAIQIGVATAKVASDAAQKVHEEATRALAEVNEAHEKAVRGIASGTLQAAIDASELTLRLQQEKIDLASKGLRELEALQEKLSAELQTLVPLVDELKKLIDNFNPVTALLDNWIAGIDEATAEYILASSAAGKDMLLGTGNPLSRYSEWFGCYGPVFTGVPVQVGTTICDAKNALDEFNAEVDKAIANLPEWLQWVLFPARKLKEEVTEELRPHMRQAALTMGKWFLDPSLVDFIDLLINPEFATRAKLNEVYSQDDSGKGLLLFEDVAAMIEQDMGLSGGTWNPQTFVPILHSVTLAKLSLLDPGGLNQLVADLAPGYTSIYGSPLYPASDRFSILVDTVRSIDGNHQWQAYGLPYPRRLGVEEFVNPDKPYGFDYHSDASKGMRIWVDPYLRSRVFLALFPQGVMGVLSARAELQAGEYNYRECALNPFPATQNLDGKILPNDPTCAAAKISDRPLASILTANASEYAERYFTCDVATSGYPHWTVVGSFRGRTSATAMRDAITAEFPDLHAEVWQPAPHSSGRYWTVMMAACTDEATAQAAAYLARSRGIAPDAFVWVDLPPWQRAP